MNKKAVMGLIMIAVMFGSTMTIGIFQSLNFGLTGNSVETAKFPESSIIDYDLSPEVKSLLLQNGITVMRYSYSLSCQECLEAKSFLESIAYSLPKQLLLVEIVTVSESPDLVVSSFYGEQAVYNTTQQEIFKSLCSLMPDPPITCATLSIK